MDATTFPTQYPQLYAAICALVADNCMPEEREQVTTQCVQHAINHRTTTSLAAAERELQGMTPDELLTFACGDLTDATPLKQAATTADNILDQLFAEVICK